MSSRQDVIALILKIEEGLQLRVILLLYQWWNERNRVREGDRRRTVGDIAFVVHRNTDEFLELHKQAVVNHTSTPRAGANHLWIGLK